jgi:putative aldouronate transport system substrate-binding protein
VKKNLVIILSLSIIATLAGCSKNTGQPAAAAEPVREITMVAASLGPLPQGIAEVQAAVNAIVEPSIGVKVKINMIDGVAYADQVNLMFSSGEKMDLVYTMPFGSTTFGLMSSQNQLMDITGLIDQHAPDLVTAVNDVIPSFLEATKVNGRLLGVSGFYNKVLNEYFLARGDLLEKYGLDISGLQSLDDIEAMLGKLAPAEPNMAAVLAMGGSTAGLGNVIDLECGVFYDKFSEPVMFDALGDNASRLGVVFLSDVDKVVNLYKTDIYKAYLKRVRSWYQKGYVYKDAIVNTEMQEELVKSNKGITWFAASELGVEASKSAQIGYSILGKKVASGLISTGAMRKFVWAVPSISKEAAAALKFLNVMYTSEQISNLLTWGIEGRDYVTLPDGRVDYPEGITPMTVPYHTADFLFGNQFTTKVWSGNPSDLRQQALKENRETPPSPLLGFAYDPNPVQNEIAALSNVIAQYRPGLESGTVDPETELPKFIDALDRAGAEKLVVEFQKQLDAWKAAK